MRPLDPDGPLRDNPRADLLLSSETRTSLEDHAMQILTEATQRMSSSTAALFSVLRSVNRSCDPASGIYPIEIKDICNSLRKGGIPNLIGTIMERLQVFEDNAVDDCDELLEQVATLRKYLEHVDPDDDETSWALDNLKTMGRVNEGATEPYHMLPFAMMDDVSLICGDEESKADSDDKTRKASTSTGKPVDFLHIINGKEYGQGMSTRRGFLDRDFLASIKVSTAQIKAHKDYLSNIFPPAMSSVLNELLMDVAVPFYQVYLGTIRFYLVFNVGSELYILHEWGRVSLPNGNVSTCLNMAEIFLISRHIMLRSADAVNKAEERLRNERNNVSGLEGIEFSLRKYVSWTTPTEVGRSPIPLEGIQLTLKERSSATKPAKTVQAQYLMWGYGSL
ncbi:uncharacterized protein SPPG_02152 [Spizellomyces punctatus DAOM BR117]|uniref:Uncharacterized protein n=1 Tax=Spizellomyces punctatus (strain DAOM BR117) TaxID=645134 RepID=A0A0L0HPY5_SPIPD|nr:uncharacterized protein SPPG_02152 [Spizellomyces punctatus DAOM BR117]KND03088.1 hypothetical protein SPPG_02152 [Spizellomyces punctatus DAOM BR117]|eukprot:XP_016611127.1 hypothetical protein SPPG_02152 [Spizellomyces punctatus DAOM BR117]